jgi:hypothetical protein
VAPVDAALVHFAQFASQLRFKSKNAPPPEIAAGGAVQTLRLGVLQLSAQK